MENKVYIIISGEYSDWSIKGFRYNKNDAQQYCAEHNRRLGYDEFYIEEVSMIRNIPKLKLPMLIEYSITFDINTGIRDEIPEYIYTRDKKKSIFRCNSSFKNWWFSVKITTETKKKAIKIAIDYFNKFKYLVETYNIEYAVKEMGVKDINWRI